MRSALLALCVVVSTATAARAQQPAAPAPVTHPASEAPVLDETINAGEAYGEPPARRLVSWNEFEGPFFTVRFGGDYMYDYAAFVQDEVAKGQVAADDQWKLRDGRVVLNGRLKFKRETTWSAGLMYDKPTGKWLWRQTGIMVAVPEIWGDVFVGRSKEGFSLNKVMIGYAGWGVERAPVSDAMIPILADGVKWLGAVRKARLLWNVGFYGDALSEDQSFSTYGNQVAARVAWLPVASREGRDLVHLGFSTRWGKPKDHELRLRSRPGAWAAPYFVDTQTFAADSTFTTGIEAYYRPGPLTAGTEIFMQKTDAPASGDPFFHGSEYFVSYLLTGETRSYNTRGGYFNMISPARPVFSGGPGAWELVAHYTSIDLDSAAIQGGKYWRFTPMVNWFLSDNMRLAFVYGYGSLNRFGAVGKTHFLQTRIQLTL